MVSRTIVIKAKTGLHARPATMFINLATKFEAEIMVKKDTNEIDAKSIIGILSLAARQGTELEIIANGIDEQEAVDALVNLIENEINVKY